MAIKRITDILSGELYTLREACQVLRVSEPTVRRWVKTGRLRAHRIGRDFRFLGSELLSALTTAASGGPRPLSPESHLLKLAGIGDSGQSDVSENHDYYLIEALRKKS